MGGCVGPYVCRAFIIKIIDSILSFSFLFASKLALSEKKIFSSYQSNRILTKKKSKQTRSLIKTHSVALSENKAQILLK